MQVRRGGIVLEVVEVLRHSVPERLLGRNGPERTQPAGIGASRRFDRCLLGRQVDPKLPETGPPAPAAFLDRTGQLEGAVRGTHARVRHGRVRRTRHEAHDVVAEDRRSPRLTEEMDGGCPAAGHADEVAGDPPSGADDLVTEHVQRHDVDRPDARAPVNGDDGDAMCTPIPSRVPVPDRLAQVDHLEIAAAKAAS